MTQFTFEKPKHWNNLTFTQKVEYACLKLSYFYAPYTNKLIAKDIVKQMCGDKIKVAKIIKLLKNENDFTEKDMNQNHIIKGVLFTCNLLFDNSHNFNYIKNKVQNHCHYPLPEYEKKYIDNKYLNKFIIEEIIDDKDFGKNGFAITYLIKCIKGIPEIFIVIDKLNKMEKDFYFNKNKKIEYINMDYNKLNLNEINYDIILPKKEILDKMYDLACILSKPFEFVRIDLYIDKNDDIYFSEFTFLPGGKGSINHPPEIDKKLSELWT
jgi:hypothetical protein